jgi:putative hydrolase of the HAD superfamily
MHHLSYASFVFPEAEKLMEKLQGKYKMAIITNGLTQVQTRRIRNAPLADYFQEVVISEEIGISKPSPQIFQYTLDKLGHTDARNVLMIGDSLTSDIKGGEDYGMDTCWFNPGGKENHTSVNPTYEVRRLMDILDIL